MRKFLVKHFVLDYEVNLFGKTYNAVRASRVIYPVLFITGIQVALNPNYPTPNLLLWISYFISALVLFFGFIYFKIKPAKWDELDSNQKRQYGYFMGGKMSNSQYKEWLALVHNNSKKK